MADAGRAVGAALTYTVNLLNPSLVIIGGELSEAGDVLLDPIRAAIAQSAVPPAAAAVRVTAGSSGRAPRCSARRRPSSRGRPRPSPRGSPPDLARTGTL